MSEDQLTFAGTRNAFDRAPFRTVLLTPTDRVLRVVRRSEPAASGHWFCPLTGNAHVAETVVTSSVRTSSPVDLALDELPDAQPPDQCACGRSFGAAAVTEGFDAAEWRRSDTGALVTLATAPLGAVWEVDWLPLDYHPPGDRYVWIRVPGSDWSPDAPAANCPLDDHFQAEHHCWVRSGPPSRLTVGKDGATCDAGMGSIATPIWHGLVRDGWVISAPIIGDYPSEALVAAQTRKEPA